MKEGSWISTATKSLRVALAGDSKFIAATKDKLRDLPDFAVIAHIDNGIAAKKVCVELRPDVLILELILPYLDGLGILQWIRTTDLPTKVLAVADEGQESLLRRALEQGADYVILKPFGLDALIKRIQMVVTPEGMPSLRLNNKLYLEELVLQEMTRLGVPPHFKGYRYLKEAIVLVIEDQELLLAVTKRLYPKVAQRYNTTGIRWSGRFATPSRPLGPGAI